jgi:hypothetical protein
MKPQFQRHFPTMFIVVLGLIEFLSGLIILVLELLVFDIAIGLWCAAIDVIAGAAILVLGKLNRRKHCLFYDIIVLSHL